MALKIHPGWCISASFACWAGLFLWPSWSLGAGMLVFLGVAYLEMAK
jgi:hypothetical protein